MDTINTVNKKKIKKLTLQLLKESYEAAKLKIDKALNSGAVDTTNWEEDNMPLIEPKSILIAILMDEADQYNAKGTSFEKKIKKQSNNIKLFL